MMQELFIGLGLVALRIVAAMALSAGALYSGMGLLDRLTSGIEEWKEVRKGNAAMGVLVLSVMLSMMLLMEPLIVAFVYSIRTDIAFPAVALILGFTLFNYIAGLLASTVLIFLTINLADRLTPDIEEFAELKKGNIAVALVLGAAIVLISLAVRGPLESGFDMLITLESGML